MREGVPLCMCWFRAWRGVVLVCVHVHIHIYVLCYHAYGSVQLVKVERGQSSAVRHIQYGSMEQQ